jgi:uncharacterized membrane protein YhaH (DUF805 family)
MKPDTLSGNRQLAHHWPKRFPTTLSTGTRNTMPFTPLFAAFFLPRGRVTRSEWLTRVAIAALVCAAFGSLAGASFGEAGSGCFALLFIWIAIALATQRLHDVGRSGGALSVAIIPVIGPLWVLGQLLKRGVDHPNRFGADPASRIDYLLVDTTR